MLVTYALSVVTEPVFKFEGAKLIYFAGISRLGSLSGIAPNASGTEQSTSGPYPCG